MRGGQGVGGTGTVSKSHFLEKTRRGRELKKQWESAQRRVVETACVGRARGESAGRRGGVGVGH